MAEQFKLSIDSLIKNVLDGEVSAIVRYHEMIWKICNGYVVH